MTQVYLTQCATFTASHGHGGTLAESSHLHTFAYEVTFHGPLNTEGYLIDFRVLQDFLARKITHRLNGSDLNTLFECPTTEALAIWIFDTVRRQFPSVCSVKVAEDQDRWITYMGEQ
ncbi:MAG: 6-carboxytetrahydropterin synthase [Elusimicrobiaceae bacterium]|nr:6-carboxytetrahydropterin synthase [Elusimicrobiaceae bacterium]